MPEIIVVAEAEADARMVCRLADRVLIEKGPDWLDEKMLQHCRKWVGFESGRAFTTWRGGIKSEYQKHKLPRHLGHVAGEAQGIDTAICRKAILLARKAAEVREIVALVLSRDLDSQPERKDGIRQAVTEAEGQMVVLVAAQNPKREAWVLNGFVCQNSKEEEILNSLSRELTFNPCENAERLRHSSSTSDQKRNPKRILAKLTRSMLEREEKCWSETPLATLHQRGIRTHLAEYLNEVENKLLPLITGNTAPTDNSQT